MSGTCISCGGNQVHWLYMPIDAKKNIPTKHDIVVKCETCGLGAAQHLPTVDEVPDFYKLETYYTHGESHIQNLPPSFLDKIMIKLAWKRTKALEFSAPEIASKLPAGASICEIGSGHSAILIQFKELGFEVVGVDPDPSAREYAATKGITVLPGTGEELAEELRNRQFDLVIMSHSLEHCIDPVAAVRNAYRLTKPGGMFYCEVPNCGSNHFQTFNIASEMFDLPRHLYFFDPKSLQLMLAQEGFAPHRWFWHGFTRNYTPGWRAWERAIADRAVSRDPLIAVRRHTRWESIKLLARTLFADNERKYDSVGLLATKA